MNQTTNYELSLYEGTDLFNPLTVENVNFNDLDSIIKAISNRALSAATELLTGTVHAITRADSDCAAFIFPATANFTAGETFTVDGVQVTALLPSGTTLPTGAYVIGSNVLCVLNGTLMTVYCDAGSDAQTLQGHAASYFATDADLDTLGNTVSNLSTKVGSAVLTTTAPDCSGAINELNSNLMFTYAGMVDANNGTCDLSNYRFVEATLFVNGIICQTALVSVEGNAHTIMEYFGSTMSRNWCEITVSSKIATVALHPQSGISMAVYFHGQM